jgi:hypothetical protein
MVLGPASGSGIELGPGAASSLLLGTASACTAESVGRGGEYNGVVDCGGNAGFIGVVVEVLGTGRIASVMRMAGFAGTGGALDVPAAICSSINMSISFRTASNSASCAMVPVAGAGGGGIDMDAVIPSGGVRATFAVRWRNALGVVGMGG